MKRPMVWNPAFALVGLGALLIYILACTSFSPDDSKVLFGTYDPKSDAMGVSVYDRKTGKSELLFEPFEEAAVKPIAERELIRPQWINDGHDVLAIWLSAGNGKGDSMNLDVLPFDRRGPARTFLLKDLGENAVGGIYTWPAAVIGSSVFLCGESNSILRLNLETGKMERRTNEAVMGLVASANDKYLIYLGGTNKNQGPNECGVMDPETYARTTVYKIKETNALPNSLALSPDGTRFAYMVEGEKPQVVHVLESGNPDRKVSLEPFCATMQIEVRQFSPVGDVLYGAFKNPAEGPKSDLGILEIPMDGSPIRETTLISGVEGKGRDMLDTFQVDLSHDGKTLAVDSLWLGANEDSVKPEDCALFLVDLTDPQRKVTKVPIPRPPKE